MKLRPSTLSCFEYMHMVYNEVEVCVCQVCSGIKAGLCKYWSVTQGKRWGMRRTLGVPNLHVHATWVSKERKLDYEN